MPRWKKPIRKVFFFKTRYVQLQGVAIFFFLGEK